MSKRDKNVQNKTKKERLKKNKESVPVKSNNKVNNRKQVETAELLKDEKEPEKVFGQKIKIIW
jgi:hypothetical protein